jgi:hypothetical protein
MGRKRQKKNFIKEKRNNKEEKGNKDKENYRRIIEARVTLKGGTKTKSDRKEKEKQWII